YDQNSKYVKAQGNVKIIDHQTGNVFADHADVKDDMSEGSMDNATLIFNNGSYIKSPKIIKRSKDETDVKWGMFSICPNPIIAKDNEKAGEKIDLFYIRSRNTNINNETDKVKVKSGTLLVGKVPVFYTPYLSFPLPSSKRESGFLTPAYLSSTNLGAGVMVPYYFNIDTNKDLTTSASIHPMDGHILLNNHYRHLLKNGYYETILELANNKISQDDLDNTGEISVVEDDVRWHLTSQGEFVLSKNVGLEFNINNVGDKDYLEDYHNFFINNTVSDVTLDYIKGRSYHYLKTVRIQEIENSQAKKKAPFALPIINSYIETDPGYFKERYSLLTNATVIHRKDGLQYRRVSMQPTFKLPYNIYGNLFEAQVNMQGDFYDLENDYLDSSQNDNFSRSEFNYRPEASLSWSLPLSKRLKRGSLVVEPMANIVSSYYEKDFNSIPSEDVKDTELTQSNSFVNDRFMGFDRNENGTRVNYGIKSALYNDWGRFGFAIGQGYRKGEEDQDVKLIGFNNSDKSNLVGRLSYGSRIFNIGYDFQLNESSYDNEVNQVVASLNLKRLKVSGNYILTKETVSNSQEREQFGLDGTVKLSKRWEGKFNVVYDLIEDRAISSGLGLNYDGCCVAFGAFMTKSNPSDFIEEQTSYSFQFTIKGAL
ncbi:MAG: LPS assembly protein LptD, partial [Proteobacteria bacterium]|nr:LPS assembly protein LptD [Pseudomonadota bacterium]